ncbi:MAG: hypothetical protein WC356_01085 [Candidatus Micrarchaeia archaeon]|jgi:hypothetical protein
MNPIDGQRIFLELFDMRKETRVINIITIFLLIVNIIVALIK